MKDQPITWKDAAPVELWHGTDEENDEAFARWWRAETLRRFRRLRALSEDEPGQVADRERCARDVAYYLAHYGVAEAPGAEPAYRNVPLVLWPKQAKFLEWLLPRIEAGRRSLVPKTRELGITWIVLQAAVIHPWLFDSRGFTAILGAHKEVALDRRGDRSALFEKIRYILGRLPPHLLPAHEPIDNHMVLRNQDTGSEILGEATSEDFGKRSRASLIFIDELSNVPPRIAASMWANSETVAGAQVWVWNPARPDHLAHRLHRGDGDKHPPAPAEMVHFLDWRTNPTRPPDFVERRGREIGEDFARMVHEGLYGVAITGRVLDVRVSDVVFDEAELLGLAYPDPLRQVAPVLSAWDFGSGAQSYLVTLFGLLDFFGHDEWILWVDQERTWLQTAAGDAGGQWLGMRRAYGDDVELWCSGDPAGRARESDAESWETRLQAAGVPLAVLGDEGVNGHEWKHATIRLAVELFDTGRLRIHRRCKYLLECIERWRWRGVRDGDEIAYLDKQLWTPAKDRYGHGGETLLYLVHQASRFRTGSESEELAELVATLGESQGHEPGFPGLSDFSAGFP